MMNGMSMKFKRYNSIEQVYRQAFVDKIIETGNSGGEWVVTEKVHGANFSFITDGKEVRVGKRTATIGPGDSFYSYERVLDRYKDKILDLFTSINKWCEAPDNIQYLNIFGELMGGGYPHEDVEQINNVSLVQNGIHYCPDQDFYMFDIRADRNRFLAKTEVQKLGNKLGIPCIQIEFKGTFEECLVWSAGHNAHQSIIHKQFGLPMLSDNIREGNVVSPNLPEFIGESRIILKDKNDKWLETSKAKVRKPPVPLSDKASKVYSELAAYINENRLNNVISKIGAIGQKDFGKLLGQFVKDAIDDFQKDNDTLSTLEKDERKRVNKLINGAAATMIRNDFLNIIDRTNNDDAK